MPLLLGIDTGTSGTKTLLCDEIGHVLASDTQEYPLSVPRPQWAEQHPDTDWWAAAQKGIRAVLAKAHITGDQVGAVGLTGQMHGSVFLDSAGEVLRPALLWCDSRTGAECDEITRAIGGKDALYAAIGQPVFTSFTAPKILWVKKHEPHIYERIAHILLPKDYIRYKLTGEFATDASDASGTSLLDVRKRDWSAPMLAALDIPRDWLPPVYESPTLTGTISPTAAEQTGLRAGTPVVAGASDNAASAVGCGIVETGAVLLSLGTSGVLFAHLDQAVFAPDQIQTFCHAVPGKWHFMGCILSAAGSLEWYRDTFAPDLSFAQITDAAAMAPPGCEGLTFLPYLAGERNPYFDPDARGVFFGATRRATSDYFARAVLEGVAFAFADLFALLKTTHTPVAEVRATGGGVRSPLWQQILADVTQHSLRQMHSEEGPALGAALLAGVGIGTFASVPEACAATVRTLNATAPQPAVAELYRRHHALYRALYPALQSAFGDVARLTDSVT